MYALKIFGKIFIFDLTTFYGLFDISEVNLNGYLLIEDYRCVLMHYKNNYYDGTVGDVEQLFKFLFRVCVNYVRDVVL